MKAQFKVVENDPVSTRVYPFKYHVYKRLWWGGWELILETDLFPKVIIVMGGPNTKFYDAMGKEIC